MSANKHFTAAVEGLLDFYPVLASKEHVAILRKAVTPLYRDSGNAQLDYEDLKDKLGIEIEKRGWNASPEDD